MGPLNSGGWWNIIWPHLVEYANVFGERLLRFVAGPIVTMVSLVSCCHVWLLRKWAFLWFDPGHCLWALLREDLTRVEPHGWYLSSLHACQEPGGFAAEKGHVCYFDGSQKKRWDRWYIYIYNHPIVCIYHLYTTYIANWVIICYLPPIKENRGDFTVKIEVHG